MGKGLQARQVFAAGAAVFAGLVLLAGQVPAVGAWQASGPAGYALAFLAAGAACLGAVLIWKDARRMQAEGERLETRLRALAEQVLLRNR